MRSFANSRWLLAMCVVGAVVLALLQEATVAQPPPPGPGGAGTTPTGASSHPCDRNACVGIDPDLSGDVGDCTECFPLPPEEARCEAPALNCVCDPPVSVMVCSGTGASSDGIGPRPAGGGGLNPETGDFTCTVSIGMSPDGGFT